ncbi:MAG: hypothetical protein JWM34_3250 [Ilumatobacteraceae bacterium]|nr:hypothetical protein [Ilumatobacteraceae bacterium]
MNETNLASIRAFATLTPTADAATRIHQAIWAERGTSVAMTFAVPACPYTSGELVELRSAGREVAFIPPEVATQSDRHILGLMFPLMGCYSLHADNVVPNDANYSGWFDYEAAIDAPWGDTDEGLLIEHVGAAGRNLMSLNQYIVASQDSRLLTGRYLDERRSWSRIGARVSGRVVAVRFDGDEIAEGLGDETPRSGALLTAYDLGADNRAPVIGGRTTGSADIEGGRATATVDQGIVARGVHPSQMRRRDPAEESSRLASLFVDAGFHKELGLSADDYVASLPIIEAQPAQYVARLDVPLIVETRIAWGRQYELTGIAISKFLDHFPPPAPIGPESAHLAQPYTAWFNAWGQRFEDPISPPDARADLAADEIGANLIEGAAMLLAYPELNESGRFYDFLGYIFPAHEIGGDVAIDSRERTAGVCRWRGRPEFACNLHPTEYAIFRPLVRGKLINPPLTT